MVTRCRGQNGMCPEAPPTILGRLKALREGGQRLFDSLARGALSVSWASVGATAWLTNPHVLGDGALSMCCGVYSE